MAFTRLPQSLCPVLHNFVHTLKSHVALEPNKHLDAVDVTDAWYWKEKVFMAALVAYVDGGSLGSPGSAGIGVIIEGSDGRKIRIAKWIGRQDNNVAEYVALLEALQLAITLGAETLHVYSDSEVVVRQMNGEYACRSPRLHSLNWVCRKLARSLQFSISHVRRELNTEANGLAASAVHDALAVSSKISLF